MRQYLLDTNIFVFYIRKDAKLTGFIDNEFNPLNSPNRSFLSVVSEGELKSFALNNNWGFQKRNILDELMNQVIIIDINDSRVIDRYAEIDTFSQGNLKNFPLNSSAKNMGKNDLWIAATASVYGLTLLSSDKDFDHLHSHFLKFSRIDLEKIK